MPYTVIIKGSRVQGFKGSRVYFMLKQPTVAELTRLTLPFELKSVHDGSTKDLCFCFFNDPAKFLLTVNSAASHH